MTHSLLPPNRTPAEEATELTCARMSDLPVAIGDLWNPDACPADLLPWLAWALSVEEWAAAWSEEHKRAVVRRAIRVHRLKGTRRAVELALDALGFSIDLVEWFEEGAPEHTFRLDAFAPDIFDAGQALDAGLVATITRLVEATKPARAHWSLRVGERRRAVAALSSGQRSRRADTIRRTPGIVPDVRAPTLSARAGHRLIRTEKQEHRFTMQEAA